VFNACMLNPAHHTTFKHAWQHSNANETFHSDQYIQKSNANVQVSKSLVSHHVGELGEWNTKSTRWRSHECNGREKNPTPSRNWTLVIFPLTSQLSQLRQTNVQRIIVYEYM
jgi:hypothetical protein